MKITLLSIIFCTLTITGYSQSEDTIPEFNKKTLPKRDRIPSERSFKKENIVIGGSFDLGLSNVFGYFMLAPSVGYRVLEPVEMGLKLGYSMLTNFNGTTQHNIFGGPYVKVYPVETFFMQLEGELTYVSTTKLTYSNALVGLGFNSFYGDHAYMSAGIKLNLVANEIYYNTRFPMPFIGMFWRLK